MLSESQILTLINGAQSLQEALQMTYNNNYHTREEEFFTALRLYFGNKPGCEIIETHKKRVRMPNAQRGCEISDLLIISYSRHIPILKINFLQAKKVDLTSSSFGLLLSQQQTPINFKFHLDAVQYKLLNDCPMINPLQTGLPNDILFNSCSPAITSYGVFYKNPIIGKIDMAYEITQLLHLESSNVIKPRSKYRTCNFATVSSISGGLLWRDACGLQKPPYKTKCHSVFWDDLYSTLNAETFEYALKHFRIGSPLCKIAAQKFANDMIQAFLPGDSQGINFKRVVRLHFGDGVFNSRDDRREIPPEANHIYEGFREPRYIMLVDIDHIE